MSSNINKDKDSFKSAIENRFNTFDYNTFENDKGIGKGGFGEVKKAYSNTLKKYVALKCLRDPNDNDNDNEIFKQFMNESRNINAVNHHDNIIDFYGVSIDISTEKYYLVLQYAEDGNLRTYLRNNFEKLDWNEKINMAKDIARDYINIYSNAWNDKPNLRSTIENIYDSLETIRLEYVYTEMFSNDTLSNASNDQASSLNKWKSEGFFNNVAPTISQDDAVHEKDASISGSVKSALGGGLGVVGDSVQPYLPLFTTVTIIIKETMSIYENAKYNKKVCNSLMDQYFMAFHRFIEVMKNIKQFITNISTLSGFQKYFHANSVKEKFESLTSEFETVMNDLHFTTTLRNDEQRRIDQESLSSDLEEIGKFLSTIGENVVDSNQYVNTVLAEIVIIKNKLVSTKPNTTPITANEIDPKELKNPYVGRSDDRRGNTVIRKMLNTGEDVACKIKIIDAEGQKIKAHLAILGKLKESNNILKFYGLSKVEDQNVMVFEWADFGSLQEVYMKYDIGWRSKVQMALDICRGLVFLQTCEILHHDIRCANIMMTKQLVPKLSNFKYARHTNQATTDIKEITDILRWMAPEKMLDPKKVRYTFKCEIFSFGMLLWELLFQKIPYEDKDMNQIKDHVLKGGREKITMCSYSLKETQEIQKKFLKIIIDAWQQDIDIRASLMEIFLKLQKLAAKYPMGISPTLNLLGVSQMIKSMSIVKSSTNPPDSSQNFILPTIVPLEEGIEAHKNKDHQKAWLCFKEHVKFKNSTAMYWMGYYLSEGLPDGKKDPVQANLLFKEAADDGIADAQLHYAFSLFNTPGIEFDPKVFVSYLTKAANGGNIAAQYNLGDMWFNGKILGIKDIESGKKYLKLAALSNDPRSIKILKDNGIDF
ncbi:9907_t:CDS:2 [Diversispora eburnea]|uniref:9907_t:CDS:1 n=1 Tax=Diversispora eburnea TaxID=1213867 RepID=A0A9N9FMI7_9GLOM|nr:9907_t:CDS:2 [Diversispora eburnea]